MTTYPTVALTGHRPQSLTAQQAAWVQVTLALVARRFADVYGTRAAVSGLALGCDTWWALSALAAGLELVAFVPFEAQADRWADADRTLWLALRAAATSEHLVSPGGYDVKALHARNDMLIRSADAVIAVVRSDKPDGGAASALGKALAAGKPVLRIDPTVFTVRWETSPAHAD